MSTQNLYMSEKDQEYQKRRIISLQGDEIGFKLVHGNRKDVIDMKKTREQILDNMEKKMRFNDIVKQYNLFFNKKLNLYDKKYLNDLADILDSNDRNYLEQRKLIESKKKNRLFHTNQNFHKYKKTIDATRIKNLTLSNFKYNKKLRKITIKKEDSLKKVEEEEKKNEEEGKIKIKKIRIDRHMLTSNIQSNREINDFNKIQIVRKNRSRNTNKEKRFYVSKITKKKITLGSQDFNHNSIFSLDKRSERNETTESNNQRCLSYLSDSNIRANSNNNNHFFTSYFDESHKEKSFVFKKFRKEHLIPLGKPIRIIDIIKLNPIIFQKPYSILGEIFKREKVN